MISLIEVSSPYHIPFCFYYLASLIAGKVYYSGQDVCPIERDCHLLTLDSFSLMIFRKMIGT